MSHSLVKISRDEWPKLRDLYDKKRKYSNSYNLFHALITRIKDDEYINAIVYSLDGIWQEDGLFIAKMYNLYISCNILTEDTTRLSIALSLLDLMKPCFWFALPKKQLLVIINLYEKKLNLKIEYENDAGLWHHVDKNTVKQWEITLSADYSLKELSEDHAELVDSVWPHRYATSLNYVKTLIKKLPNIGLFDKSNKLMAWCLVSQTGMFTLLQVLPEYQGKGFGALIVKALSKKLIEEGFEVVAPVVEGNKPSLRLFEKLGFIIVEKIYLLPLNHGEN